MKIHILKVKVEIWYFLPLLLPYGISYFNKLKWCLLNVFLQIFFFSFWIWRSLYLKIVEFERDCKWSWTCACIQTQDCDLWDASLESQFNIDSKKRKRLGIFLRSFWFETRLKDLVGFYKRKFIEKKVLQTEESVCCESWNGW